MTLHPVQPSWSSSAATDRFWKTREQIDGVDHGPVWIADANDRTSDSRTPLWLTWEQAEQFARKRGLTIDDV
jgi:hypothetical protein